MALSRLTKGVVGGFFTLDTRIAFGHGCDCPSYGKGLDNQIKLWFQCIFLTLLLVFFRWVHVIAWEQFGFSSAVIFVMMLLNSIAKPSL